MMLTLEKIIEYMKLKARLSHPIYVSDRDIENLAKHNEEILSRVWFNISTTRLNRRFTSDDCPFCIIHGLRCLECDYKKVHGRCAHYLSDWSNHIIPVIDIHKGKGEWGVECKKHIALKLEELTENVNNIKHISWPWSR